MQNVITNRINLFFIAVDQNRQLIHYKQLTSSNLLIYIFLLFLTVTEPELLKVILNFIK